MTRFIEEQIIQPIPAANLNRDESGAPKTMIYGGATRARVSSQAWKRVIRKKMQDELDAKAVESFRTKRGVALLSAEIEKCMKSDPSLVVEDPVEKAKEILDLCGISSKKDKNTDEYLTDSLFFYSELQLKALAKKGLKYDLSKKGVQKEAKKALQAILNQDESLDLALFGRMLASDQSLSVEGSTQVAHAFSTHELTPEYDFFTALDDAPVSENSGAAMMGNFGYSAPTLYRYANVNFDLLKKNLGQNAEDLAYEALKQFLKDFALTMPNGKQNTFASKTVPSYVLITVRDDTPDNLASAFEKPVRSANGYVEKSIIRLEQEKEKDEKFLEKPAYEIVLTKEDCSKIANQASSMDDLLNKVVEKVKTDGNSND